MIVRPTTFDITGMRRPEVREPIEVRYIVAVHAVSDGIVRSDVEARRERSAAQHRAQ